MCHFKRQRFFRPGRSSRIPEEKCQGGRGPEERPTLIGLGKGHAEGEEAEEGPADHPEDGE